MPAGANAKIGQSLGLSTCELRTAATRAAGGGVVPQSIDKRLDRLGRGLDVDFDSGVAIEHPAVDPVLDRRAIDKRPKADALHDAANRHPASDVRLDCARFHRAELSTMDTS